MDLYILTTAKDRSAAAITSAADTTALEGPDGFPQLVLGTTEPINVYHLTGAGAYEAWSADPTYTVVASLGLLTTSGLEVYAEASLSTVITNGKGGSLALTTQALIDAAQNLGALRPRLASVSLTLQITVTDPDGNRRVYAQLPVQLNYRVPSFTATPSPAANYLTAAETAAAYLARANNLSDLSDAATARTNLGLGTMATESASDYQPKDATLTALAAYNTNGILTQTAPDTFVGRTVTGTANEIAATNGDGVSGNPTLSLPSALTFTGKTVTGGTYNSATIASPNITGHATLEGVTPTGATGSGNLVFATSPALTTPNLGTPSAATLTNATGLPISTGVSGLGSGVASLLAGASSGTGGPAGTVSPTFTGTPILSTTATATAITGPATTNLTLSGGSTGASLVLGQGANGGANLTAAGSEIARFTANRNLLIGGTTDISGTGGLKVFGTTASTSSSTGAVVIGNGSSGGLGVGGAINAGGTITSTATSTSGIGAFQASSDQPRVILYSTTQAADTKRWDWLISGSNLLMRIGNDADSAATNIFTFSRTGTTFNSLTLNNGTFAVSNTTEATTGGAGALTVAGGIYAAKAIVAAGNLTVSGTTSAIGAAISSTTNLNLAAGSTGVSSLRIPHGSAPTSPVNGDVWTTTAGLFVRINGATVGPLS